MKVVRGTSFKSDDKTLVQQLAKGNEKAYYILFEKYWESLYRISVKILNNRDRAQDVVQEVFLSLWQNREKQNIENIGAYLNRAAKFASLKELRDDKSQMHDGVEHAENLAQVQFADIDSEELQAQISIAINELPERCKEVFVLSREAQLSNKEIAEKLNLSQRTVETHISNALKHLKTRLPNNLPVLALAIMVS